MCFFISIVVGYANTSTTAKKYNCLGPAFITTGDANGQFILKNYIPTGWDWQSDELRIIKPATSGTKNRLVYVYESQLEDVGVDAPGWYDLDDGSPYNEEGMDIGTGFLTSYGTETAIAVQSAGQVYDESPTIDCRGNKYQIIPNALPRVLKFSEIVPTGWDWQSDELRIIKPSTSGTDHRLVYVYENQLEDVGVDAPGWYDLDDGTPYNDEDVKVGDGFLLMSGSGTVQITFPKAIK